MDRKESFWMSMIEKYEKRNCELDERQYNLQHRLEKLKCKLSSSNQNVSADTSSTCSCTTSSTTKNSSASNKESRTSVPSTAQVCLYKPKTSEKFIDFCGDQNLNNDSMELQYIAKLHDLVNREKQMKMQVKDMEEREKAFIHTLKRADQMYTALENKCKKHLLQEEKLKNAKYQKMTRELLNENACLCDQLQDTKLELKHCIEKLQGPIARQMDQERRKSKTLEDELKLASEELQNKDSCYSKDLCTLQKKLAETTKNLASINALNDTLQKQMCSLSCKYKDLQKDLIDHKINEAHTLERANKILAEKEQVANRPPASTKQTQFAHRRKVGKDPDSLYTIARKLSKTIGNVERCDRCSTTASRNLKDTMRGIVLIADMINYGCNSDAVNDSSDSDDNKPPPPSSGSYKCNPCTDSSNLVNEQPVRDVNLQKPTNLCMGDNTTGGPVDDDTYAPIESLASSDMLLPLICTCEKVQAEMHLIENKEPTTDIPKNTEGGAIAPIHPEAGDVQVLTQVETTGNLKILVETDIEMCNKLSDDIHITTAFTKSGVLEVVTEGPAGIIETTMTLTPCGSVEVITKVVDYPDDLKQSDVSSIVPDLTEIKEKISAAVAEDVLIVSQIRPTNVAAEKAALSAETPLKALEELTNETTEQVKTPPAEPAAETEKPKCSGEGFEIKLGGGEVEDYNVQIELTNSPFLNELSSKHFAKTGKLLEKSRVSVTSYYAAKALENVDQDVEYALGSGDKSSGEILQGLEEASLVLSQSNPDPTITSSRFKNSSDTDIELPTNEIAPVLTKSVPLTLRTEDLQSACAEVDVSFGDTKIEDGDAVKSVYDIDNDRKFLNLKNVQIKKKILLREEVRDSPSLHVKSIMATPNECDCDACICDECSPKCMSRRNVSKDLHPPDCNCVDCLCKPCASFPADYKTRVHPPGCDCIDCLCMQPPCFGTISANKEPTAAPIRTTATAPVCDNANKPNLVNDNVNRPNLVNDYMDRPNLANDNVNRPNLVNDNVNRPNLVNDYVDRPNLVNDNVERPNVPFKSYDTDGVVKKESHVSTCTCLDCLLTCGIRETPRGICKGCNKPCMSSKGAKSGCSRKITDRGSVCSCDACDTGFCFDQSLKADVPIKSSKQSAKIEPKLLTQPPHDKECKTPMCEDTLKNKQQKELQDIQACLDKIKCACAEAEGTVCAPTPSSGALMALRCVIQTLQEKCKGMKDKMDNNRFCNLLGINSGDHGNNTGSNIYCCACDDDRSVMEEFSNNPCKCITEDEEDDSSSCCSSCSVCCTEFEDVTSDEPSQRSNRDTNRTRPVKRQGSSCSCLLDDEPPLKEFKSASDSTCPICYPEQNKEKRSKRKTSGNMESSQAEPQRMLVCMSRDTLKKQVTNAPLAIIEMRKIEDALLIKWSKAKCKNVVGYEVVINGQIKTKVRSADRTSAMIYNLSIKKPITVAVYVITSEGRQQPSAKAVFDV